MNNKPFDLQKALAGEPVITRSRKRVLDLYHFKHSGSLHPVLATIEGSTSEECYTVDGKYAKDCGNHSMDLFMAPKPVDYWVATGRMTNGNPNIFPGEVHETEQAAIEALVNDSDIDNTTVQTHKITRNE